MFRIIAISILFSLTFFSAQAENVFENMSLKMKYLNKKQSVLSQNIANSETPNYKAKKLEPLKLNTKMRGKLQPTATRPGHITPKTTGRFKVMRQNDTTHTTLNGNDVDLEDQMIKMSENDLEYRTTTGIMRQMNNLLKSSLGPAGGG